MSLYFADPADGWLLLRDAGGTHRTLYSTHDGAHTWHRVPGLHAVGAIAVSGNRVYAVAAEGTHRAIYSAPAAGGTFTRVAPSTGAGLTAGGRTVYDYTPLPKADRGDPPPVLTAVRAGKAERRTLPCRARRYSVALGVSAGGELFAVCGGEPSAGNQDKRAYLSTDGGRQWKRLADPSSAGYVGSAAIARSGLFYTGHRSRLWASRDGGRHWSVAVTGSSSAGGLGQLRIPDGVHGSAVDGGPPNALYLTNDGGKTWSAARLPSP